jgi:hypothetical protein
MSKPKPRIRSVDVKPRDQKWIEWEKRYAQGKVEEHIKFAPSKKPLGPGRSAKLASKDW